MFNKLYLFYIFLFVRKMKINSKIREEKFKNMTDENKVTEVEEVVENSTNTNDNNSTIEKKKNGIIRRNTRRRTRENKKEIESVEATREEKQKSEKNENNKNVENNLNNKNKQRSPRTKRRTRRENTENRSIFKSSKLKIIPLGGLHEIGKNITVFEYEDEIIVKNQEKIKGMVITHGHEDHIGGIPYFLKQINVPIYATRLTVGLINNKLEEHKLLRSTEMHTVNQGDTIKLGKNFKVEFIRSSHSIPDSVMLAITTPAGTILHTGDFKVDYTPIDGQLMNLGRIAELGNQGILALMSDSTNAER